MVEEIGEETTRVKVVCPMCLVTFYTSFVDGKTKTVKCTSCESDFYVGVFIFSNTNPKNIEHLLKFLSDAVQKQNDMLIGGIK